jgi:hypothetical protein
MAVPPHKDTEEDVLEELDLDDAALVSHQSAAHAPQPRANVKVDQPSIVLAEDVRSQPEHEPAPVRRRGKRSLEPTLVIRDRKQIDELQNLRKKHKSRQRARAILMWGFWGLLAFGLGGAIALFVAKRQAHTLPEQPAEPAQRVYPVGQEPAPEAAPEPSEGLRFIDLDAPLE